MNLQVGRTFTALRFRNYRLYLLAQIVSQNGTWMQRVAQYWLVLHLTGSGLALGLTGALENIPLLFLSSWGGLIADRVDKRRLIIVTQCLAGLLGLLLAALTLSGRIELWMIYTLAFCLGLVKVFDNPGRQSFIMEMVGPEHIPNAVALNSTVFTSSRMIGPALGGLLIAYVGTGLCFLYNGLSFFAVVVVLLFMRTDELKPERRVERARGQIREGLKYVWSDPELRLTLIVLAVVGTFAFNWNVVLPLMAQTTFRGGPTTYGVMLSMLGVGAFGGALVAAQRSMPTTRLLVFATLVLGALMVGAAVAPTLTVEMLLLVATGAAMVTCQATGNTLLQLHSKPEFRGRVMALYVTAFLGTTPIGAPIVGWVSQEFGPRFGLGLGAVASLLVAVVFIRRVWRAPNGPLPDPTPGLVPRKQLDLVSKI